MTKSQFEARDLHNQLWDLRMSEFDASTTLDNDISKARQTAADGVAWKLPDMRQRWGEKVTVAIARREVRRWLWGSDEGKAVESAVGRLLGGG